jgi:hypothetical protein
MINQWLLYNKLKSQEVSLKKPFLRKWLGAWWKSLISVCPENDWNGTARGFCISPSLLDMHMLSSFSSVAWYFPYSSPCTTDSPPTGSNIVINDWFLRRHSGEIPFSFVLDEIRMIPLSFAPWVAIPLILSKSTTPVFAHDFQTYTGASGLHDTLQISSVEDHRIDDTMDHCFKHSRHNFSKTTRGNENRPRKIFIDKIESSYIVLYNIIS